MSPCRSRSPVSLAPGPSTLRSGPAWPTPRYPASLLRDLGAEPLGERRLPLADGGLTRVDIGEVRATVGGLSVTTLAILGDDDSSPTLGAYTLDGLGLAVDPVAQRLIPKPLIICLGRVDNQGGGVHGQLSSAATTSKYRLSYSRVAARGAGLLK